MPNMQLITLYGNQTLQAGPPLADRQGTTGAVTRSVIITNNSPYAFLFTEYPGGVTTIQPGYQATISVAPNTQWRLSYLSGAATTASGQVVTMEEGAAPTVTQTSPFSTPVTTLSPLITFLVTTPFGGVGSTGYSIPANTASGIYGFEVSPIDGTTGGTGLLTLTLNDQHGHSWPLYIGWFSDKPSSVAVIFPKVLIPSPFIPSDIWSLTVTFAAGALGANYSTSVILYLQP